MGEIRKGKEVRGMGEGGKEKSEGVNGREKAVRGGENEEPDEVGLWGKWSRGSRKGGRAF